MGVGESIRSRKFRRRLWPCLPSFWQSQLRIGSCLWPRFCPTRPAMYGFGNSECCREARSQKSSSRQKGLAACCAVVRRGEMPKSTAKTAMAARGCELWHARLSSTCAPPSAAETVAHTLPSPLDPPPPFPLPGPLLYPHDDHDDSSQPHDSCFTHTSSKLLPVSWATPGQQWLVFFRRFT